jgi:hypothetical protein
LKQRVDLLAQGQNGLAENFRICEQDRRFKGREGLRERREGAGLLAGVQAVLKGIVVGGLAAAAARENGGGNGSRQSIQHGSDLIAGEEEKTAMD